MLTEGRPTMPANANNLAAERTFTANRALQIEEPLIFEVGRAEVTGVDLPDAAEDGSTLGDHARRAPLDLPGLSEPEAMRHYVRLSQKNYAIDSGIYPLGSCTMKHNPRINEKMARLPGFADIHPLQPASTVPGAFDLIAELGRWLLELTGMATVAVSPKAGAHGELCGMMAIKAALEARGDKRSIVLVPESAHGTNPATAALLGYKVVDVPARDDGTVDPEEVQEAPVAGRRRDHADQPQHLRPVRARRGGHRRCGPCRRRLFLCRRRQLQRHRRQGPPRRSRRRCHAHQPAQDLLDAPRRRRPGGRAGGASPTSSRPSRRCRTCGLPAASATFVETRRDAGAGAEPFGRMSAFHGQMGMFVRAMSYMLCHGADGMKQASEDAVLNANYVRAGLATS